MEKNIKRIKIVTITCIIILLALLAFIGLYVKINNVWENVLPGFNYGIELNGIRELKYTLDTTEEEKQVYVDSEGNIKGVVKETNESDSEISLETTEVTEDSTKKQENSEFKIETRKIKTNSEEIKTIQNFEKAKKIIQNRLEKETSYEYNLRLDTVTGELIVEVPDDDNISIVQSAVTTIGKLEIIDEQTGVILLDSSDIKNVQSGIYDNSGYQVCLQINFNKEGTEKLKNISNKYIKYTNDAGEEKTDYVTVNLDGQAITTTYFGEELSNGILQIPIGNTLTEAGEASALAKDVDRIANIINEEPMPIVYTLTSDNLIKSTITSENIKFATLGFIAVIIVVSTIIIIKYKAKGYVASILSIGYISLLILIVRYTEISITFNSIIAFLGITILNYWFIKNLLIEFKKERNKKESFWLVMKNYYLTIIPICIIAVVFTFMPSIIISSIGMMLFWGLILQALYNIATIYALDLF